MLHVTITPPNLLACLSWLIAHSDALICSARLLGGPEAVRRVARLINTASSQTSISRRFMSELDWLYGLMALENVGDPDSIETMCFSAVDPESPAIAEICVLTEALAEHIEALREATRRTREAA